MERKSFVRKTAFALVVAVTPCSSSAEPEVAIKSGKSILGTLLSETNIDELNRDLEIIHDGAETIITNTIAKYLNDGNVVGAYITAYAYGFVLNMIPSSAGDIVLSKVPIAKRTDVSVGDAVSSAETYFTIIQSDN